MEVPQQFDLIHLVKMCKKLKKPFHGKYFINFLKKFPPHHQNQSVASNKSASSVNINNHNKDSLIRYAQSLLEANYLYSVKSRSIHIFNPFN
jgi:hypothetical protein